MVSQRSLLIKYAIEVPQCRRLKGLGTKNAIQFSHGRQVGIDRPLARRAQTGLARFASRLGQTVEIGARQNRLAQGRAHAHQFGQKQPALVTRFAASGAPRPLAWGQVRLTSL